MRSIRKHAAIRIPLPPLMSSTDSCGFLWCHLFVNATRKRAKVLLWDGTGLCICAKRLEQGGFTCLWRDTRVVRLTMSELQLFLEGSTLVGRIALSPAPFVADASQKSLAPGPR